MSEMSDKFLPNEFFFNKTMKEKIIHELSDKCDQLIKSKNYVEAIECCKKSIQLEENNPIIYYQWGQICFNLAQINENEALYTESFEKFEKATIICEDFAEAYFGWGLALSYLANIKEDEKLFRKSYKKFEKAIKINENFEKAYFQWGYALSSLAIIKGDEKLFIEACRKYAKAMQLELNTTDAFATYTFWGTTLSYLAILKPSESLFREAIEKFNNAIEYNHKIQNPLVLANTFNYRGIAYIHLANLKKEEFIFDQTLYRNAIDNFKEAINLSKAKADFYFNLGCAQASYGEVKFYLILCSERKIIN